MIKIERNNTSFFINENTIFLDWFTKRYPTWEPQTFKVLDDFLVPDKSFIDIGAHIGLVLLYVAPKVKRTIGVECDHVAFDSLEKNVECNDFKDRVHLEHAALYNSNSEIYVGGGERKAQWGGSGIAITNSDDSRSKKVSGITIDSLIEKYDFNDCGLIKIDIEGGEAYVMDNMKGFFESQKPNMYISIHPHLIDPGKLYHTISSIFKIFPYVYNTNYELLDQVDTIQDFLMRKIKIGQGLMSSSNGHELIGTFKEI